MCGYIGNLHQSPAVIDLFNQLQLPLPYPVGQSYMMRMCDGLVTASDAGYRVGPAMWWFAMKNQNGELVPDTRITSFNARNLDNRMWRQPIQEKRGVVFATEIGETQGKAHYLMRARGPLAIGTVYRDYQTPAGPVRAFALITRPPHPRFARYHEKAMPLFLPTDLAFLQAWLDPHRSAEDPVIANILANPPLTTDFLVTPVKTFKRGEPVGPDEWLVAGDP